jgi:hypothetical protein
MVRKEEEKELGGGTIASNIDCVHSAGAPEPQGATMRGDEVSERERTDEGGRRLAVATGRQAGRQAALVAGNRGEAPAAAGSGLGGMAARSGHRSRAGPRGSRVATCSTGGKKVRA